MVTREIVKRYMTATAATVGVVIGVNTQLEHKIPHSIVSWLADAAILIGIFGASPIGRLFWKDPPMTEAEVEGKDVPQKGSDGK